MNKLGLSLVATALAASQLGATDCGQIIKDPGFDLWCGQHLCDWKIEKGQALEVPTWHTGDEGVSLVGDDVLIAQQTEVTSGDSTCIQFSMLTDVALDADVHLQFDVFGDGTIDYDQPIPTADWQPVSYRVAFAAPWNGITFQIAKHGAGTAILAQISALTVDASECAGAPIVVAPHPDGGFCAAPTDCASGVCNGTPPFIFGPEPVCGDCATDADCAAGDVCGTFDALPFWLEPYRTCITPRSRPLGELCGEDAECLSGICDGTCSLCSDSHACASGQACMPAAQTFPGGGDVLSSIATYVCDPDARAQPSGTPCFHDDDCQSDHCAGGLSVTTCADEADGGDGRACTTDLDCPEDGGLNHTACIATGLTGGTCQ